MSGIILGVIWSTIVSWVIQFWGWLIAGAIAVLGLLFSPTLRKYTLGAIAVGVILLATFLWGYNSNHKVEVTTHACSEFQKHVVSGPETDKVLRTFKRNGLCV